MRTWTSILRDSVAFEGLDGGFCCQWSTAIGFVCCNLIEKPRKCKERRMLIYLSLLCVRFVSSSLINSYV